MADVDVADDFSMHSHILSHHEPVKEASKEKFEVVNNATAEYSCYDSRLFVRELTMTKLNKSSSLNLLYHDFSLVMTFHA